MGAKRKRISAIGEQQSEDREESPGPPAGPSSQTKRRKKSPHYSPTEICQELYETIRNHKTDDSRFLCETFIRAPKRRTAADYYEVVSTPIDLLQIGHKLKTEEYEEIEQLTADMELMITNAKSYYKKTSQEYKDACDLWDLYVNTRNELIAEALGESSKQDPGRRRSLRKVSTMEGDDDDEDEEEKSDDTKILDDQLDDPEDFEALFGSVVTAKDNDRDISTVFQLLPPKSKYPEYYQIIKQPVDLKMIAQNIKHGRYRSLDEVERDLLQMVKNAKTFNEPKSLIYKDACTIKKIVQNKKIELQTKRAQLPLSDRKKKRETKMIIKMTDICADLQYPTDDDVPQVQYDEIDEDEDSMLENSQMEYDDDSGAETVASEDNESPFWTIFNAVKSFRDANGQTIYEPFVKLPSRRFYPDYYDEIDRPMSLANIRKKIKYKQYRTIEKIATDLNLVFENAKQYNKEESKIHQDAVILQKVLYDKKKDLDGKKVSRELFEEDSHQSIPIKKPGRIPEAEKKRPGRKPNPDVLRKRLMTLYKCVFDYNDNESRPLRFIFMQLPSKKEYPDYYDVITNPIDMSMIEQKIKSNQYANPDVLLTDFELMFNNARRYNEEGSLVYNDANTLQKALKLKWKNICQTNEARKALSKSRVEAKNIPSKLQRLYDAINNFSDVHGRTLSTPFLKLPLKSEYPDYFEIIKKPIDMQRIQQKLLLNQYESVEDMVADFVQMFDNASKYNEPDSLIYKDALTLQRVCLEKKMELTEEGSCEIPDVRHIIQELTTNLFISTYNYQDEEGRCLSDSFSELPERDPEEDLETSKLTEKPLSFDQIKRNIDRGRYRRMDKFQEDMFQVFERARRLCRTDSQLYEDAVEMQHFFIKKRDEICKNGEILLTPALSYTERHLQAALDAERNRKMLLEKEGTEKAKRESEERQLQNAVSSEDFFKYKEQTFHIGDTVYIEPREEGQEPHILCIEKLFVDSAGVQTLYGFWFYRPNETFHSATRKFLEKEVFKSDVYTNVPLTQVIGRCFVMHVKEYFKMKPEGFSDKDVYVCESRYSSRLRGFKKIKIWPVPRNDQVILIPREVPLVPIRVASVFVDKEKDEADDGDNSVLDKIRLDVRIENIVGEEGLTYFEQLTCKAGSFKIGDCVYARSAKDRPVISRIDKIWSNQVGEPIINSTCFVFPVDIEHSPTRLFYKKEIFLTTTEETLSMNNIEGKCSVLHIKDYYTSRIGDIPEDDVYVCESKYQEQEKTIKKLGKGLKKYTLSPLVTDDELYFFKKPLTLQKEPSPLLMKVNEDTNTSFVEQESFIDEDSRSMDTSISSVFESFTPQPEKQQMSSSSKKVVQKNRSGAKPGMRRQISGYIVYSGVIRKQIQHDNPDCSFGDISRIVGTKDRKPRVPSGYILFSKDFRRQTQQKNQSISFGEMSRMVGEKWRNLSLDEKQMYEGRAKKIAEEQVAKQQEAERAFNESLSQQQQQQQQQQSPWGDLSKMSPSISRPATPAQGYTNGYHPMTPMQRGATPPNQRFMSPYQQQGFPGMRPMGQGGYSPSPQYAPHPHAQPHANVPPQSIAGPVPLPPPKPPSPVFVSVPPRTQRLLHSEAYLRYIEGLHADKPNVGDWEKNLTATPENTKTDESRMPASWLAQGAGYHGNVSNALWALRDLMLKDTLNITRTVPFESLCKY